MTRAAMALRLPRSRPSEDRTRTAMASPSETSQASGRKARTARTSAQVAIALLAGGSCWWYGDPPEKRPG